jgi:hypothetical protein
MLKYNVREDEICRASGKNGEDEERGKETTRKTKGIWVDDIKMDLGEIG